MTDEKLPEWPDADWYRRYSNDDWSGYHRARADAAIARLKVAVEALQEIRERSKTSDIAKQRRLLAEKTLAQIGELPKEGGCF